MHGTVHAGKQTPVIQTLTTTIRQKPLYRVRRMRHHIEALLFFYAMKMDMRLQGNATKVSGRFCGLDRGTKATEENDGNSDDADRMVST